MDYSSLSDVELLARIVGPRVAGRIYQGALAPLFEIAHNRGDCTAARTLGEEILAIFQSSGSK